MKKIFFIIILFATVFVTVIPISAINPQYGYTQFPTYDGLNHNYLTALDYAGEIDVTVVFDYDADLSDEELYSVTFGNALWYDSIKIREKGYAYFSTGSGSDELRFYCTYTMTFTVDVPYDAYFSPDGIVENRFIDLQPNIGIGIRVEWLNIVPLSPPAYVAGVDDTDYIVYFTTNFFRYYFDGFDTNDNLYPYVRIYTDYGTTNSTIVGDSTSVNARNLDNRFLSLKYTFSRAFMRLKSLSMENAIYYYTTTNGYQVYQYIESGRPELAKFYVFVSVYYNSNDGVYIVNNNTSSTGDIDVSSLYQPIKVNTDQGIIEFLASIFTQVIPNIMNNFIVWFMCEAPLVSKITKPFFLLAVQTANITLQWVLPLVTATGIFGGVLLCILLIRLFRGLLS